MKYYSIGEFANRIGKTIQTLRNWDKKDILKPSHVTKGGTRYYSQEQLNHFLGLKSEKQINKKVIGYCRVSSHKQKDDLERQIDNVKTYMYAKGYQFEIITDIGSGINYNKKGLNQLIDMVTNSEVEKIVVLYKDRLIRFGYELIENLCNKFGTTIEIIDNTEKTEQQELVEDLVQIVTVFSCRLQGKRANKAKKMIKELIEDDKDIKNNADS
ncbi:IS607 family transposase [Clostridium butyricum]|uniref:IS607 family transposase n=1 Tax=Clostridium butyricum TaxID=1492 RepID=UPI002AAF676C|nr:IS607 family transposase [Clostridium butyricum]